jgi:hypothetical protein
MGGRPVKVALTLSVAPDLYIMVGMQLGWGPTKTELILPGTCDPERLPLPRDAPDKPLPDVIHGFKTCLGVPRHPTNEDTFIATALEPIARRHDNLLEFIADVSDEDPFAALKLVHVCGVYRFGHTLSAVPPGTSVEFCE